MENEKNIRKTTPLLMLALGFFVGLLLYAPFASANPLSDFWNNFIAPLSPMNNNDGVLATPIQSAEETPSVPLYQPVIDYEKAVVAAVKKASPTVVSITVSKNVPILENCPVNPFSDLPPEIQRFFGDQFPQFDVPCEEGGTELQEVGGGSGFIISPDGLIVTNKHVVLDENASYTVFTNDGKKYEAAVLARDPLQDIALIKINATGLSTVELGDSDSLELGQTAIAIGNALAEFRNTVSVGTISGLARTVRASGAGGLSEVIQGVIQTDAAINPGNSGGPLLNLRGQVIGINTAIVSGAQNIGFAIPINAAKRDINSFRSTGQIQIPFLGVRYRVVTPEIQKSQNLPVDYGALIQPSGNEPAVTPGSPAEKAGLKTGDIVLEINGIRLDENNPLSNVISGFNVGDTVSLKIQRGNSTFTSQIVLAKRP